MSIASRARAAAKEEAQREARRAYWRNLQETNAQKLTQWYATQGISPEQREVMRGAAINNWIHSNAVNTPYETVPHWVLPIGEALVDPNYFYPPTAEINGKLAPVLTVQAFHHTLPKEGVTFQRAALGERWVRSA